MFPDVYSVNALHRHSFVSNATSSLLLVWTPGQALGETTTSQQLHHVPLLSQTTPLTKVHDFVDRIQ